MKRKLLLFVRFLLLSTNFLKKKSLVPNFWVLCLGMFFVVNFGFAQTNTWDGSASGTWTTNANWSLGVAPTAAHDVVIPNVTRKPTISAIGAVCASLVINSGSSLTLTNAGGLTVGGNITNNGTITPNSSTITINGATASLIQGTGTTNFGNLIINKSTSATTVTNSDKVFAVGGALTITQGNLTLSATDANYGVTGDLTVSAGGTLTHSVNWDSTNKQLNVGGDIAIDGAYSIGTALRAHVSMTGSTKTVHTGTSALNIFTLATNGTITADGAVTVNDNFWAPYYSTGTFSTAGYTVNANGAMLVAGGNLNVTGGILKVTNGLYVGYDANGGNRGTLNLSGGTITTDGIILGGATNTGTSSGASVINQTGGTLVVNGDVTINQPPTSNTNSWNINASTATVSGNISFAGTNSATNRIGKINITTGTLNANGGITFAGSTAVTKVIDMSGGAGNLNLRGALNVPTNSSTLTAGTSSNFNYIDSNPQTINFFSGGGYNNLKIDNISSSGATLSAPITSTNVRGNLSVGSINSNSIFNNGGYAITLASTKSFTVANTSRFNLTGSSTMVAISGSGSTKTFGPTSTVNYGGAAQAVSADTYGNLVFSGTGIKTTVAGTSVQNNLLISGPATASVASSTIIPAGSLTLGVYKKIDGTWGSTSSSATYKDNAYFELTSGIVRVTDDTRPTVVFSNLTASQTICVGTSTITLSGTASDGGTVFVTNGSGITITINGNTQSTTVVGSSGNFSITYNSSTLPASGSAYQIVYDLVNSPTVNVNFKSASNNSTTLKINAIQSTPTIVSKLLKIVQVQDLLH